MSDKTLEKDIINKLITFEKNFIAEKKNAIVESLIKENPSRLAQLIFVFNNALMGLSLGKLLSLGILDKSNVTILGIIIYILIAGASFRYIKHYWKREENKRKVIKDISALRSLKGIKQYVQSLSDKFKYSFLFLHNENIKSVQEQNNIIKNEDIKNFIISLNQEQLDFIMEPLKKNTLEEGFNIQLVSDIKKLCLTQNKLRTQEEKLLNNLKVLTGNSIDNDSEDNPIDNHLVDNNPEDDLLNVMAETYILKKDKKIDFKKNL